MTIKPIILVVGSTGMLGFKIVCALLDKGETQVRAMVRSLLWVNYTLRREK